VPKGFFPQQDTGLLVGVSEASPSISFPAMMDRQRAAADVVRGDPDVQAVASFIGADGTNPTLNVGRLSITLKPRRVRKADADTIIARLAPRLREVSGIAVYLQSVQDLQVDTRTSRTQFQLTLEDADPTELDVWAPRVLNAMRDLPVLRDVASDRQSTALGLSLVIDRDMASQLGISTQTLDDTLYDAFGQRQVSTIFTQLNLYRVILEVAPSFQQDPVALRSIYVRSANGSPISLDTVAHYEQSSHTPTIAHQGQFPAATLSFNLAPGEALGDAVSAIDAAMLSLDLPPSVHPSFQGTAKVFSESLANEPILILAALITMYIVLGILYESYIHPITILSTLPSAGVGALLALLICRIEFSIIALIGIILLIGIVKKNAIMMIDFALEAEREKGLDPESAIHQACLLRFRPIMMTTMAALLGGLPMALGGGTGAELRRPLGIAIVGGLLISQVLTLYTTPVIYLAMDRLRHLRKAKEPRVSAVVPPVSTVGEPVA
jgi:multidrug efflux pump subunit AcrB